MVNIILASKSPRRQELLNMLGLNFTQISAEIDEIILPEELPNQAVQRIAVEKAKKVAEQVTNDSIIISADTIVVCNGIILGKPSNKEEAYKFLNLLSGKSHEVMTGVAINNTKTNNIEANVETTLVHFRSLTSIEINHYIATNEPFDKAGGYGIQGKGALLVEKISGCYFNVVGLPITTLYLMLKRQGVDLLGGVGDRGI